MPVSVEQGKEWTYDQLAPLGLTSALDVGPGAGRYADLLRPLVSRIDAVEVWEPYVDQYNLRSKYDKIFIQNFLDFTTEETYDVVVMGDVLEHFNEDDAKKALDLAKSVGKYVLISTPTVDWPQGPHEGNHFESHLSQFYWEDLQDLDGFIVGKNFEQVGVVLLKGGS